MSEVRWPGDWLRGVLELCVLGTLAAGPTYGYAISQRLAEAGLGTVRGGTLYPLLTRLEAEDLVESSWQAGDGGPGRKYFTLTRAGREALAARSAQWLQFVESTNRVLQQPTRHLPDDPRRSDDPSSTRPMAGGVRASRPAARAAGYADRRRARRG